jgi:hypothetical protein
MLVTFDRHAFNPIFEVVQGLLHVGHKVVYGGGGGGAVVIAAAVLEVTAALEADVIVSDQIRHELSNFTNWRLPYFYPVVIFELPHALHFF